MTSPNIADRAGRGLLLPIAALIVALGCGGSPSAPRTSELSPVSSPTPTPTPSSPIVSYRVSGTVTDESGARVPSAFVEMWYAGPDEFRTFRLYTAIRIATYAGVDGRFEFSFETDQQQFLGNPNLIGIVRARNDVQVLPGGTPQIVRDLGYHPVETILAGQSVTLSIGPSSSRNLTYFLADRFGTSNVVDLGQVKEAFRVQVPRSGRLTVQTASGATLRGFCYLGPEECDYAPLTASTGILSGQVQAGTIYEIAVSIPSHLAPQQFLLATSLD